MQLSNWFPLVQKNSRFRGILPVKSDLVAKGAGDYKEFSVDPAVNSSALLGSAARFMVKKC
jgi:hypothetical protein